MKRVSTNQPQRTHFSPCINLRLTCEPAATTKSAAVYDLRMGERVSSSNHACGVASRSQRWWCASTIQFIDESFLGKFFPQFGWHRVDVNFQELVEFGLASGS